MNTASEANMFLKFLQFPPIRIVLGFVVVISAVLLVQIPTLAFRGIWPMLDMILLGLALAAAGGAYYGLVHIIERRQVTEFAFQFAIKELTIGILIGTVLFSTTIGILWFFGYYQVSGLNNWGVILSGLELAISAAAIEELLIRGLFFRIIEESLGTWIALVISALLFGLLHLGNPNATLWGAIAISIEAGIMLAAAFVLTRRLWLSIGIHFAWNFAQGAIFGVAVSGNEVQGLLRSTLEGPAFFSGGSFGAEASIFAVAVCSIAGLYLLWQALKQGNFIQAYWLR